MLRRLNIFRRRRRESDDVRPEVELVRSLAGQISIPAKAGPVLESVEAFAALDRDEQRAELPRVYLLLEQYLTDVDPVRTLTRSHLREITRERFPSVVSESSFRIVFETTSRQELLLCRLFLLDVLGRATHVLGAGSTLAAAKEWIRRVPEETPDVTSIQLDVRQPESDGEWVAALIHLSETLFERLHVGLGEATARIYDGAYAALAHRYSGLETFPAVVRLLPDGLLDEERIQSLARHGTMARVQGALSEAQRSALESATQLQAVLSTVGEGIVTVDADRRFVLVNREVERTFGYGADELIGADLSLLISGDDSAGGVAPEDPFFKHLGECVAGVGRRRDGSTFPIEVCINETRISGQLFYTAAVRDVTVQRRYERELVDAKEHAEEMTRLKTAFLANMSHEFRTPLAGIMGAAEILDDEVAASLQEFTQVVSNSAHRLLATLDSVLEFARLESGEIKCRSRSVALDRHFKRVRDRFAPRAKEKGLTLSAETDGGTAHADPEHLDRILDLLVENAIRFTHQGRVHITARTRPDGVEIVIQDTGIGIGPSFLPHAFDEFRQESSGHARSYEGTGLGLAIARRLAEAMGGTLQADSVPGEGSTFTLSLGVSSPRSGSSSAAATIPSGDGRSISSA